MTPAQEVIFQSRHILRRKCFFTPVQGCNPICEIRHRCCPASCIVFRNASYFFFQFFLIFLASDHVTGIRIPSGILRVWPELYIQAAGRNHGFGLHSGNSALVTAKKDQRKELHRASCYYYNEHFEMLRDGKLHFFFFFPLVTAVHSI